MLISREWLTDFVSLDPDLTTAELAHELTLHTVEVEGFDEVRLKDESAVVAVVLKAIETGTGRFDVTVDLGNGHATLSTRQVLEVGEHVAASGAFEIPTFGESAHLGLEAVFAAHQIVSLDAYGVPVSAPGTPLEVALGWRDSILEIDNKSLTNRPDLWGHLGIARELAAIFKCELRGIESENAVRRAAKSTELIGEIDRDLCSRMSVFEIEHPGPPPATPWHIRSRLARIGQRSINLYADLTNYVMFATGQPSHAYDATTLQLPLGVSRGVARDLPVLGGQTVTAGWDSVGVIADQSGPVSVAGVVGGAPTSVSGQSTRVVIEMGAFNPRAVRTASLALGIRTDASSRFEKGLDTQSIDRAQSLFSSELHALGGLEQLISRWQDCDLVPTAKTSVDTSLEFLNSRMGTNLAADQMAALLRPLGFEVDRPNSDVITVRVPTWRATGDVSIPNDILEEVARIIGYDNLPPATPLVALRRPAVDPILAAERRAREFLAFRMGGQEVVTYPWISDRDLELAGVPDAAVLRIETAEADRSALRPSLIPGLLRVVDKNASFKPEFSVFELGTTFAPSDDAAMDDRELLPTLSHRVSAAYIGGDAESAFRRAVGALEGLGRAIYATALEIGEAIGVPPWVDSIACRSVSISNGNTIGHVGLISPLGVSYLSRRLTVACFEVQLDDLHFQPSRTNTYSPISVFPSIQLDVSLVVPAELRWSAIARTVQEAQIEHVANLVFVGEYRSDEIGPDRKSVTFTAVLASNARTLDANDRAAGRSAIVRCLRDQLHAEERV